MIACPKCFGDAVLARRVARLSARSRDGSCDRHARAGIAIARIAEIVDPVFREDFYGTYADQSPYLDEPTGVSLDDALYVLVQAEDPEVRQGLANSLADRDDYWPPDGEEAFYSDDYEYFPLPRGADERGRMWDDFRASLLHRERFFNEEARGLLARIFEGVHRQRDADRRSPVYLVGPASPDAVFFRARIVNGGSEREAIRVDLAKGLGPPPERMRRAGRLNASGVAAFYGAYDLDTCVAELRPPVGSTVVGARFTVSATICVLDLTRFEGRAPRADRFDASGMERVRLWRFMTTFMREIAKPVMPGDEHLDYVPTQAVAEYLAGHHVFELQGSSRRIDAIVFRSSQMPAGRNIAILGEAARVRALPSPRAHAPRLERRGIGDGRPTILPVDGSFEVHAVGGAHFSTRPLAADDGDA